MSLLSAMANAANMYEIVDKDGNPSTFEAEFGEVAEAMLNAAKNREKRELQARQERRAAYPIQHESVDFSKEVKTRKPSRDVVYLVYNGKRINDNLYVKTNIDELNNHGWHQKPERFKVLEMYYKRVIPQDQLKYYTSYTGKKKDLPKYDYAVTWHILDTERGLIAATASDFGTAKETCFISWDDLPSIYGNIMKIGSKYYDIITHELVLDLYKDPWEPSHKILSYEFETEDYLIFSVKGYETGGFRSNHGFMLSKENGTITSIQ